MIYILIFLTILAISAAAYAITVPQKIQQLLLVSENESPDEILASMDSGEKIYLLTSVAPLIMIPLLFFADLPRSMLYGSILLALTLSGIVMRMFYSRKAMFIRIESTVELVIYCDLIRSCLYSIWG